MIFRFLQGEKQSRSERFEARTAEFVRDHPGAYVIRTVSTTSGAARTAMTFGLAFAQSPRYGHLVADDAGLTLYQGLHDIEWQKPWREVTALTLTPDGRALTVDAIGWQSPKHYAPCAPNGDTLLPFAVEGVLRELADRRP